MPRSLFFYLPKDTDRLDAVAALQGAGVALTVTSEERLGGRSGCSGYHQREADEEEDEEGGNASKHDDSSEEIAGE